MLACLAAASFVYSFPAGSKSVYDMQVTMDGYVPLLGRTQNNVEVKLAFEVAGTGSGSDGLLGVTYELTDMKASMGGTPLPFTIENVKAFFPKGTLSVARNGRVVKTDVPDIEMPVRLPGLDPRRIPEISFLPIEFLERDVDRDREWQFKRSLGGFEATYTVALTDSNEKEATFRVGLRQVSTTFEDATGNRVSSEKDASFRVDTTFSGTGQVVFDLMQGQSRRFTADSEAVSQVADLKSGSKSERRVKSKLKCDLRKPALAGAPSTRPSHASAE